jgi:hypothetical protein
MILRKKRVNFTGSAYIMNTLSINILKQLAIAVVFILICRINCSAEKILFAGEDRDSDEIVLVDLQTNSVQTIAKSKWGHVGFINSNYLFFGSEGDNFKIFNLQSPRLEEFKTTSVDGICNVCSSSSFFISKDNDIIAIDS